LVCIARPSEPDWRISRIRLSRQLVDALRFIHLTWAEKVIYVYAILPRGDAY
jgi:hypothetical protein